MLRAKSPAEGEGERKADREREREGKNILWVQPAFTPSAPVSDLSSFLSLSEIVILTAAST